MFVSAPFWPIVSASLAAAETLALPVAECLMPRSAEIERAMEKARVADEAVRHASERIGVAREHVPNKLDSPLDVHKLSTVTGALLRARGVAEGTFCVSGQDPVCSFRAFVQAMKEVAGALPRMKVLGTLASLTDEDVLKIEDRLSKLRSCEV